MAALSTAATRLSLKGVHLLPMRWRLSQIAQSQAQLLWLPAAQSRPLFLSPVSSMCSSRSDQQRKQEEHRENRATEEEEVEGPEYIPKRKAKNPMTKIGYAWMIGLPTGIITFMLAKRQVDKNRLKQLKVRQRMRQSNEGEYEGSRYHRHTRDVKLDQ